MLKAHKGQFHTYNKGVNGQEMLFYFPYLVLCFIYDTILGKHN